MEQDVLASETVVNALVALYKLHLPQLSFTNALCRTSQVYDDMALTDTEKRTLFHDDRYTDTARAICMRCPVKADCLAYALLLEITLSAPKRTAGEWLYGVWGGTIPHDRAIIHRQVTIGQLIDLTASSISPTLADGAKRIRDTILAEDEALLNLRVMDLRKELVQALGLDNHAQTRRRRS
jgi:hypothetical protein